MGGEFLIFDCFHHFLTTFFLVLWLLCRVVIEMSYFGD